VKNAFLSLFLNSCEAQNRPPNCQNWPNILSSFSSFWFDKNRPPNVTVRPPIFRQAKLENIHIFTPFYFELAFGVNMKVLDN